MSFLKRRNTRGLSPEARKLKDYDYKKGEPVSSVLAADDYGFATATYPKDDFRHSFVENYMRNIENTRGCRVVNCRFEHPQEGGSFINFYIYMWDGKEEELVKDSRSDFAAAFYSTLQIAELPGITDETNIQIILKNIRYVIKGHCLSCAGKELKDCIRDNFPEVAEINYWSDLYIFIWSQNFNDVISNKSYLENLKKYCYEAAIKYDGYGVVTYSDFHIRIDDYKTYSSYGGQNYFTSHVMSDCLLY